MDGGCEEGGDAGDACDAVGGWFGFNGSKVRE